MHETLKLYIQDNGCECNIIFKVYLLFVNIRLYREIK